MTRLGIQISSVREYLQTPEDVLASFRKVSEIGYKTIQIQWINPEIPTEFIHDALKETRLECIGTQDYYDVVVSHLDEVIEINNLWGGSYITVSGIPERYQSYEGCLEFTKELNKLSEFLETKGKILNFHPRFMDVFQYDGQNSLDIIFENTRSDFQFLLDIYHIFYAGLDPIDWIYKVKGRNDLIHFKDGIIDSNGNEVLMPVGQGAIQWKKIFDATIETGVKYAFAEQEKWQKGPFQCLKESYDYIKMNGIE
jgi:sugar phosphate isomerase/epimerase